MKRECILTAVMPTKTGVRESGEQWAMTDVVLTWTEQLLNGETQAMAVAATVNGWVKPDVAKQYIETRKPMSLNLSFNARYYNGRYFNTVRTWLPTELTSNTKPEEIQPF